ncbi:hypothetical protein ACFYTS_20595 [Nocardia sp. NPDC004151]|uniref:hypothetical protein n=1 Tax=Nocardia sp. NPDC004151 TaxID=3364304 RepID=UPI0036A6F605
MSSVMSARVVLVIVIHLILAAVTITPASAEPLRPGRYRIFLEAQPAYTLRLAVTAPTGAKAIVDDGADLNRWETVLITYKPAGPLYQLLNSSTRLCLHPVKLDPVTYSVGQAVCGVADTGLWYLSETAGNHRVSLASDPSLTLYGDTGSAVPIARLGHVSDEPRARWVFTRL